MKYKLSITKVAEEDLLKALDFIEFTLKNPRGAESLMESAKGKIAELAFFPMAHHIIDDPILTAWGIRFVLVENFIAFYTVIDDTVYIIRFLYSKRDWMSILKQDTRA